MKTVCDQSTMDKLISNVAVEKKKCMSLIEEYAHFSNHCFAHPFFGNPTKEQIRILAYKHTDTICGNLMGR